MLVKNGPPLLHLFFDNDLILFGEASMEQVLLVKEMMDFFCKALGHRINVAKTKLFVSFNINFNRAMELNQVSGVSLMGDLGKCLRVPLFHKCVCKATFHLLIHSV